MIDNRNIPDADQSWTAAEKMLDRHFRKRRLLIWFVSLAIPALIAGVLLTNNPFTKTSDEKIVYTNESTLTSGSDATTIGNADNADDADNDGKIKINDRQNTESTDVTDKTASAENSADNIVSKDRVTHTKAGTSASVSSVIGNSERNKIIDRSLIKHENSKDVSASQILKQESAIADNTTVNNMSVNSNVIDALNLSQTTEATTEASKIALEEIAMLDPKSMTGIEIDNLYTANEFSWPKVVDTKTKSHITWEATAYGAAHMVNKTITAENEWNNYLQHRKYEEDAIITPSVGLALTANFNSLSLSIGAEFSTYGEKTKYFPYSNQQVINDVSTWNTFMVNVVDTDTAYIWGNQRLIETITQELDSIFVFDQDTTEEYKFDQKIAEANGVNRFYYIEIPVEVSYTLAKGKAGVGVSGGVSPAWLMHQKGYYIKTDGNGVEAISEIKTFRKFMVNARFSVDFYYRLGGRTKLVLRPQFKTNLNSVFNDDYGVKQKYFATGLVFGVSYMLN